MLLDFYLVSAAIICLCVWLALAALQNIGVGVVGRRISFVVLATVGLAPSVAPAGIVIVYVPNGVLVALGGMPMLHQPRLIIFALLSFLITAIASTILSYLLIRETSKEVQSGQRAQIIGVAQLAAIVVVIALYRGSFPNREILKSIDWVLVESVYGEQLDRVEALTEIGDAAQWRAEVTALDELIESEATILTLLTSHESFEAFQDGRKLSFGAREMSGSCSSADGMWRNDQMMRCTRQVRGVGQVDTLLYRRMSDVNGNRTYIDVEFDYDELLKSIDTSAVQLATTVSEDMARQHDSVLLGTWSIVDRHERTVNEERFQKGVLTVGPRLSFGTYAVRADVSVESRLRSESSRFKRQECQKLTEQCSFEDQALGKLRVVGSKIQIVYETAGWSTDILSLDADADADADAMVGRSNNRGATMRFEREEGAQQSATE